LFGNVRLQHHNGIIEAVDNGQFIWAEGKSVESVLRWVEKKELEAQDKASQFAIDLVKRDQERQIMWEVEKKQIMETMEKEWGDKTNDDVC